MRADQERPTAAASCHELADVLADVAQGLAELDPEAGEHIETCLRCQADVVQYRRLLRTLRTLRAEVIAPEPGLLTDILSSIESAGERHAVRALLHGRRVAYLGGIAAATAAGAAGAMVIAARHKRLRLAG